ncbi:MAG: TetR/AcrR family transcriptional regulator [Bacteroidia bacterium]|nr:TetR/AcrR family transcriptional regulator [Bacteroidia bacterium]
MIQIKVNEMVYLKDPDSTDLGRMIVRDGIYLIDEMGFEHFTFKKLAARINSTEASIYRYFENKHNLLTYLVAWYWNWQAHQLEFLTHNIASPVERIKIAMQIVTQPHRIENGLTQLSADIDKAALHRIVVSESSKSYLSKEVDQNNQEGYFLSYKRFCRHIADLVREINPQYPYPTALTSMLLESAHDQFFFAAHLPRLTEIKKDDYDLLTDFLLDIVLRVTRA